MTDRVIVYPGVGAQDTDLLRAESYQRRALAYLARLLLGRATETGVLWNFRPVAVSGLSLTLSDGALIGPPTVEDAAAMGSLPASAVSMTPLAVNHGQTVVGPFAVPTGAGQAVNHLVTASFASADTDNQVFFYQNADNLGQVFRGVGNNGLAQPSTRRESVSFAIVPGAPAAAGTQATPAVPAGTVPAFVVTLATGAAALALANVAEHPDSPFFNSLPRTYAGNPNGQLAGRAAKGGLPPSTCWDTVNSVLYTCVSTGDAASARWVGKAGFSGRQFFKASGTFTPQPGVTTVRVRAWAGGGGGGGSTGDASAGSGGGGGGYAEATLAVVPGQAYAVTVGMGGTGGTGNNGAPPTAGGTSRFGTLLTATGGGAGIGASNAAAGNGGAGGTGTGGDLNVSGSPGSGAFGKTTAAISGGIGGGTFNTSNSLFAFGGSALGGIDGMFPGGGASAGVYGGPGGNGAAGLVIVEF